MDLGSEKEIGEIVINKKFNFDKEGSYLFVAILCFIIVFLVLAVLGVIFLLRPNALMSPPDTISAFFEGFNESYSVVVGEGASDEEISLIKNFLNNRSYNAELKKGVFDEKSLVIGLTGSFRDSPYLDKFDDDSIVVYDFDSDRLFVYSFDLKTLREILDIFGKDEGKLTYPAIKVFRTQIQGMIVRN